ncbi:MAG TPA: hypothetical protein VHW91_01235 [Candidatus Dormibacteraeota bacterium]|jgi:hypothetical protein|nr:hypothetical protein [Candidatus Dormibacteraeota bacterium]
MGLVRRVNRYGIDHPWRFAAASFLVFVALSALILLIVHQSRFVGLFALSGALLGSAIGTLSRRMQSSTSVYLRFSGAVLVVVAVIALGSLLALLGVLPR